MVKFPSPIGASEEDAAWIADQPGINFDAALLAGTLGLIRRSLAWRETAKSGAGLARRPHVQVFHISWINPDITHRDFDLDTYIAGIIEALDAVRAITGAERAHAVGVCAGGQLLTIALAHLAALGRQDEVASFTLTVAVLDHSEQASPTGLLDRGAAEQAKEQVERRSSGRRPAPTAAGTSAFPVLEHAPGQYVARRLDAA